MAEQRRAKVEFAVDTPEVVELLYNSFGGEGVGTYGPWWRWSVNWKDEDATLFTDTELQELVVCAEPRAKLSLQIVKKRVPGSKRTYWRVYKPVDGNWVEVVAGQAMPQNDNAGEPIPRAAPHAAPAKPRTAPAAATKPVPPPAPPAPPQAPTAPPPVPPAPAGLLTVTVIEEVGADCYAAAQRVLFGDPLPDGADVTLVEQARTLAATFFIALVDGRHKAPPGYGGPEAEPMADPAGRDPADRDPAVPPPREPGDPGPDDSDLPF